VLSLIARSTQFLAYHAIIRVVDRISRLPRNSNPPEVMRLLRENIALKAQVRALVLELKAEKGSRPRVSMRTRAAQVFAYLLTRGDSAFQNCYLSASRKTVAKWATMFRRGPWPWRKSKRMGRAAAVPGDQGPHRQAQERQRRVGSPSDQGRATPHGHQGQRAHHPKGAQGGSGPSPPGPAITGCPGVSRNACVNHGHTPSRSGHPLVSVRPITRQHTVRNQLFIAIIQLRYFSLCESVGPTTFLGSHKNPGRTEAQFGLQKASTAPPSGLSSILASLRGVLRSALHESTALLALEARPQRSLFEALGTFLSLDRAL